MAPTKKSSTKTKTTKKKTSPGLLSHPLLPWVLIVLLSGALIGTLFHSLNWSEEFADQEMLVIDGKTWLPVQGTPLSVTILNDQTCGPSCDSANSIAVLKQNITPALITKTVDVSSEEGQELLEDFNITSIPQYFFGEELEDFKAQDGSNFLDNLPEGFFVEEDDLYHLNNTMVGFRVGKFTKAPEFADLETEPSKGSGPVKVIEFTDLQCPFCKRLYDQNKDLIDQLVDEGRITYIVKDFPLNFHADAVQYAHAVANCTLREGSQDAYWQLHATIFDQVDQWSGKGEAGRDFLVSEASKLGVDVAACLADPATKAEIDADMAEGHLYGVSGTPALFIGEQVMPGAIPPATFLQAVEVAEK